MSEAFEPPTPIVSEISSPKDGKEGVKERMAKLSQAGRGVPVVASTPKYTVNEDDMERNDHRNHSAEAITGLANLGEYLLS